MGSIPCINSRKPSHNKVWTNFFGSKDFQRCPVCQCNYIDKAIHTVEKNHGAWRRTRKISKSNGGSNAIDNFIPVCWECNYLAGNQNIEDFAETKQYNISIRI